MLHNKEYKDMTLDERVSWASGEILIAIGEGKFRDAVTRVLLTATQAAFEHGRQHNTLGRLRRRKRRT